LKTLLHQKNIKVLSEDEKALFIANRRSLNQIRGAPSSVENQTYHNYQIGISRFDTL
jgi:hypothetical protein